MLTIFKDVILDSFVNSNHRCPLLVKKKRFYEVFSCLHHILKPVSSVCHTRFLSGCFKCAMKMLSWILLDVFCTVGHHKKKIKKNSNIQGTAISIQVQNISIQAFSVTHDYLCLFAKKKISGSSFSLKNFESYLLSSCSVTCARTLQQTAGRGGLIDQSGPQTQVFNNQTSML